MTQTTMPPPLHHSKLFGIRMPRLFSYLIQWGGMPLSEEERTPKRVCYFVATAFLVIGTAHTVGSLVLFFDRINGGDYMKACIALQTFCTAIFSVLKFSSILLRRDNFIQLGGFLARNPEDMGEYSLSQRLNYYLRVFHSVVLYSLIVTWSVRPLFEEEGLILDVVYPFDHNPAHIKIIVNLAMLFNIFMDVAVFLFYDMCVFNCVSVFCGKLEKASQLFRKAGEGDDETTKERIREAVAIHQEILKAKDDLSVVYDDNFLYEILIMTLGICFTEFALLKRFSILQATYSVPILVAAYSMLFFYCWIGQQVTDGFEKLHMSICESRWYNCAHPDVMSLNISMTAAKRPVVMTGGKAVRQSYSLFLLLNSVMTDDDST